MCANEVQSFQLKPAFIDGLKRQNPAQFELYIKNGSIIANSDGTYKSSKPEFQSVGVFDVAGAGEVNETKAPDNAATAKGLVVERSTANSPSVANETSTITTKLPEGLYDGEEVPHELTDALKDVASVAADGTVTLKSGVSTEAFTKTLQKYANGKAESSVLPKEVTFPEEHTDPEFVKHLVDEGALTKTENDTYVVANEGKLDSLTTKIDNESGEKEVSKNLDLEFTVTTETKPDNVEVPNGLAKNRKARKELRAEYETRLKEWAQENPELRDEALANMKYGKQIDKRMAKMTKGKNGLQDPTEICKKYFDSYASVDQKLMLATFNKNLSELTPSELAVLYNDNVDVYNAQKGEKEQALPKLSENDFNAIKSDAYSQGKIKQKIEAIAPMILAQELGATPNELLRKMAMQEVLDDRTKYCQSNEEKQRILDDDEQYFLKHMSKREVDAKVAEQNIQNTTAHWNKAGKVFGEKNSTNPYEIHTDIGKHGRELVQAYPEKFGIRVNAQPGQNLVEGKDYDYSNTVTDQSGNSVTAYFKFDSKAWSDYWRTTADSRISDKDLKKYAEDNHITLQEARKQMLSKDGEFNANGRRLSTENILGNGNQKVGYKELKRYRNCAKTAGVQTDKDYTNWKKTGSVALNGLVGAAGGFTTAALGDLLSKYAEVVVQVGGETFTVKGTGSKSYFVDETKWVEVTDHYIDKFGTTDVSHEIPVNFKKEGIVTVETETPFTTPEGEKVGKPKSRTLKTAGGAAAIGGAAGLLRGLANMSKVQDQGTYWDGVVNLDKEPVKTTKTTTGSINIVTKHPYEVRQGEYSTEKEVNKYKAVTYRGPEAYSGMYVTSDGKPVNPRLFAQAYKRATGVNTMTKNYFYAIPELEINGVKFVLKDNAEDEYKKIKVGVRGTTTDKAIQTPKTGEVHRGKVRRG